MQLADAPMLKISASMTYGIVPSILRLTGNDFFRMMAIPGHKTMSVFKRYNLLTEDELAQIKWKEPEEKKRPWTPIWTPRPLKRRNLAGQEGFEPPTLGFGVRCSSR
jgi:hypothetical protein